MYQLSRDNLLPAILFRTSRRQCDVDLTEVYRHQDLAISAKEKILIEDKIKIVSKRYNFESSLFTKNPQYSALINFAVGAHHAGQLLPWRLLLEELMSAGLLRVLVATGTVAAGVDFPARSVVVTAHSKRGHEGFKVLSSSEFQQMSGRAGRRGKDTVGFCFVAPTPFSDARVLSQVAKSPPEPLRSAYFASPSTVLNLLKYRNVDELTYTVKNSLAGFVDSKEALEIENQASGLQAEAENEPHHERKKKIIKRERRILREAEELRCRQMNHLNISLTALERLGYLTDGTLTEKGTWAAELCSSLVLELAEAVDSGLFSEVSIEQLIGLVASLAGDAHRNYLSIRANPIQPDYYKRLSEIVERVAEIYQTSQIIEDASVVPDAALTVLIWLECANWNEYAALLRLGGVADGDAARLITQTADQLQQLTRLEDSHPELARLAADARMLILKPPLTQYS